VNAEVAEAEGLTARGSRLVFMLLLAIVIAIAMKIVGVLLITSLLIIPAATARRFSASPEQMAVIAALLGRAGRERRAVRLAAATTRPRAPRSWSRRWRCSSFPSSSRRS
jgi:hypothetical protein